MKITRIRVQSSAGPYSVVAGAGAIGHAAREIAALGRFSSVHIVSSPKVWRAVGKSVQRGLRPSSRNAVHLFNDAESAKHLGSIEQIVRSLCRAGADRKSLIIAVGGGVVGDVAGFAAASYLRGVALVHIPGGGGLSVELRAAKVAKNLEIVGKYSDNALARSAAKAEKSIAKHAALLGKSPPEAQNSITNDIRKAAERLKAIREEQARRAAEAAAK